MKRAIKYRDRVGIFLMAAVVLYLVVRFVLDFTGFLAGGGFSSCNSGTIC